MSNRYNILYLCSDKGIPYWENKGGSIHMREFISHIHAENLDISVIARTDNKNGHDNKWPIYNLPPLPMNFMFDDAHGDKVLLDDLRRVYHNPYVENFITELYSKNKFNLVYERYSLFGTAGISSAKKLGLPFVLEVNAPLIDETSKYRSISLLELSRVIEKRLFSEADAIICVSEKLNEYIKSIAPGTNVYIIPNGVSTDKFINLPDNNVMPDYLKCVNDSDLLIGFVGRLRPWHGVNYLIDAFSEFSSKISNSKLIIIGDAGDLEEGLLEQCQNANIEDKVIFTGAVEHDLVPFLLNRIDILTAPYPNLDNFYFSALKIFEYMAAGRPIIASEIGQLANVLEHDKTALLVPPSDPAALCKAMLRLNNDARLRSHLGENARREAFNKHSWKQRVQTAINVFNSIMN